MQISKDTPVRIILNPLTGQKVAYIVGNLVRATKNPKRQA